MLIALACLYLIFCAAKLLLDSRSSGSTMLEGNALWLETNALWFTTKLTRLPASKGRYFE